MYGNYEKSMQKDKNGEKMEERPILLLSGFVRFAIIIELQRNRHDIVSKL